MPDQSYWLHYLHYALRVKVIRKGNFLETYVAFIIKCPIFCITMMSSSKRKKNICFDLVTFSCHQVDT